MRLLLIWFINAAALFAVPYLMHSITMSSGWTALLAAALLGLVNALIRPLLVMLTLPVAQLALGFGANDIDGTVHKENIIHAAGAKSPSALTEERIIRTIREAGRVPAACDCNFNILRILE